MDNLAFLLVLLICPITMGVMMFLMMRGRRGHGGDAQPHHQQVDREDRAA